MTITRDPLDTLAAHRPQSADWSVEDREATLGRLLASAAAADSAGSRMPVAHLSRRLTSPRPVRRRLVLAGIAAAAAVALVIGLPLASDQSAPSASALNQIVASARRSNALVIPANEYLYLAQVEEVRGMGSGPGVHTRRIESWIRGDGQRRMRMTTTQGVSVFGVPPYDDGSLDFTPAGVGALPTDVAALGRLLRARAEVPGATSEEERVFGAVGDLTRTDYVPSEVRAALLQVLGELGGVSATRSGDRTIFTLRGEGTHDTSTWTLTFDSQTSAYRSESHREADGSYQLSLVSSALVDALPAGVGPLP